MNKLFLASLACLVFLAPACPQTPEIQAKTQTVLYVQKLQTKDGGFLSEAPDPKNNRVPKASLRATLSAIKALTYFGGSIPDKDAAVKFAASCFDKASGGFADMPGGKADVFTTAIGILLAVDMGLANDTYIAPAVKYLADNVKTFEDVRIAAAAVEQLRGKAPKEMMVPKEWLEVVAKVEAPPASDGPNGRARVLAGKAVTQLRLGSQPPATQDLLKELQKGQRSNGGYGKDESLKSDLETTYRVMRGLWMLKTKPASVDGLRNFIQKCRNEDGGYSVVPGDPSNVSGTYFAAIITHWLDALETKK